MIANGSSSRLDAGTGGAVGIFSRFETEQLAKFVEVHVAMSEVSFEKALGEVRAERIDLSSRESKKCSKLVTLVVDLGFDILHAGLDGFAVKDVQAMFLLAFEDDAPTGVSQCHPSVVV